MTALEERADVVVIGAGPGGYHAAIRAAQLGKSVVVVDRGPIGGVCVNNGCIPTKALLHVAEVAERARDSRAIGLRIGDVGVDLEGVRAFASQAVAGNRGGVEALLRSNGVKAVAGTARFVSRDAVRITAPDGADRVLHAKDIVLATGAEPSTIPGFPVDGRVVVTSDEALRLERIPDRLLVIGGGVVGLELATVFARFGAHVTVVEQQQELLPGVDLEIARVLRRILVKQGIEIAVGARVSDLVTAGDLAGVVMSDGSRRDFDQVLVATGRRPVTRGLDLDAAGVTTDARGFVPVDARRRTRVSGIWAIGDVAGGPMVAHKAMREGVVAAEAIAGDRGAAYDAVAVPSCIYTDPEVATVGLSEEEARARGIRVRIGKFPLSASGRGRTTHATDGLIKLVAEADTDLLLGMHIVAPQAESLIGEGVVALEMHATLEDLALSIHPHPTFTEAIHDAAEAAHGKAIHLVNRLPRPSAAA